MAKTPKDGFSLKAGQKAALTRQRNRANERILADREARIARREELQIKLYGNIQPSARRMREQKPHLYQRSASSIKSEGEYRAMLDRYRTIINEGTRGAQGEELKTRIVKALRNQGYVPPNGYRFEGDESGIADFVENELTADEVEELFEGNLEFSYIYGHTDSPKERIIMRDIIRATSKEKQFIEGGYAERFNEWLGEALNDFEDASIDEADELGRLFNQ